jgi:HlyD family secretion protein
MNRIKRHSLNSLCLSIMTVISLLGCTEPAEKTTFSGYVEEELIYIAAPQPGWIAEEQVSAGQEISSGDILFKLDDEQQLALLSEAQARVEQAQAQERDASTGARVEEIDALQAQKNEAAAALEFAKSEKVRWTELVTKGLAPESKGIQVKADYEAAVARLNTLEANIQVAKLAKREEFIKGADAAQRAAQAALEQAQWQLQQRTVSATVGGQVDEIFYRKGEFVNTGAPVLAILPDQGLKVRFYVPQARLTEFNVGDEVSVIADGIDSPVKAKIFNIAKSVEFTPPVIYDKTTRQKLMFMLEARLPTNSQLHPGLPVEVDLP